MVFKAKDAQTFKLKVALPTRNDGRPRTLSTGAKVKAVAEDVERMVKRFLAARRWAPLEAVFDGLLSLGDVYDADMTGTLDTRLAELADVDLDPLVSEWAARANAKYVKQVRAFIVAGERFPASRFRRKAVSQFLAGLPVSGPTKNRYRAALSVFAKWLVEREILETNPVRDVAQYKEHDPRMVWMTWIEAIRVADAAEEPYRTMFRLMAATGMEFGSVVRLTRQDVQLDDRTIAARGSKTPWRNRVVRFEEWALANLRAHCQPLVGFAPLFPGITETMALARFKDAQQAVGLTGHRLHDLRHTYAVNALKKGYKPAVVAHQLGHKDATMVTKVYGRFVPDARDYDVSATKSATVTSRKARGK
jgi:integrase